MKSLRELFRIGKGPSSSHTMGPDNAARIYAKRHPEAKSFEVTLYGSLAATGKGHMTDVAIIDVLIKIAPVNIVWQPKIFLPFHPNGMKFTADGGDEWTVYSVGGGALSEGKAEGDMFSAGDDVYEMHKIKDIMAWCKKTGHGYWEYVEQCEGPEIWDFLNEVYDKMEKAVVRGIDAEGKVVDWDKDAMMIISAVNKVAGKEIRAEKYMHWWTFIAYFMAVGESALSSVVNIRRKMIKHEKLEKYEEKYVNENPELFRRLENYTKDERDFLDDIMANWKTGGQ